EVAAHVPRGEARVAAERNEEMGKVLADAPAARDHIRDGRVDIRRAELVDEVRADVGCRMVEEGERGHSRRVPEEGAGKIAGGGFERDIGARAEELGMFVREQRVLRQAGEGW